MKVLCCHPSGLMYTEIFLRLEPLGLELVAAAARAAGHEVRILDLQVFSHADDFRLLDDWTPDAVCVGLNYLSKIPEVVDLGKATKQHHPGCFFFVGVRARSGSPSRSTSSPTPTGTNADSRSSASGRSLSRRSSTSA